MTAPCSDSWGNSRPRGDTSASCLCIMHCCSIHWPTVNFIPLERPLWLCSFSSSSWHQQLTFVGITVHTSSIGLGNTTVYSFKAPEVKIKVECIYLFQFFNLDSSFLIVKGEFHCFTKNIFNLKINHWIYNSFFGRLVVWTSECGASCFSMWKLPCLGQILILNNSHFFRFNSFVGCRMTE